MSGGSCPFGLQMASSGFPFSLICCSALSHVGLRLKWLSEHMVNILPTHSSHLRRVRLLESLVLTMQKENDSPSYHTPITFQGEPIAVPRGLGTLLGDLEAELLPSCTHRIITPHLEEGAPLSLGNRKTGGHRRWRKMAATDRVQDMKNRKCR
jgi:hypothetical protein